MDERGRWSKEEDVGRISSFWELILHFFLIEPKCDTRFNTGSIPIIKFYYVVSPLRNPKERGRVLGHCRGDGNSVQRVEGVLEVQRRNVREPVHVTLGDSFL